MRLSILAKDYARRVLNRNQPNTISADMLASLIQAYASGVREATEWDPIRNDVVTTLDRLLTIPGVAVQMGIEQYVSLGGSWVHATRPSHKVSSMMLASHSIYVYVQRIHLIDLNN